MRREQFERGEVVNVKTFDRGVVERVVVEDLPTCVLISTRDGLTALDRGEDAAVLGFPRWDISKQS